MWTGLTLQRHLIALLNFAPVESRFGSCKRRGKATFDIPINPCARSACSRSVAVGIITGLPLSNTVVSVAQKIVVGIFWERSIGIHSPLHQEKPCVVP